MSYDRLDVFDFDGTLFNSPDDSDKNKKLYEQYSGMPWHISKSEAAVLTKRFKRPINPRSGWWGKKETLMPPLVPDPAPAEMWKEHVVQAIRESKADPDVKTVIMTGRHQGLQREVLRILYDGGFVKIERTPASDGSYFYRHADEDLPVYLLGMDGPAPDKAEGPKPGNSTREWKTWLVGQHLNLYPTITKVRFCEDRPEHAEHFRSLGELWPVDIEVNLIEG